MNALVLIEPPSKPDLFIEIMDRLENRDAMPVAAGNDPPVTISGLALPTNRPINVERILEAVISGILSRNVNDLQQDRDEIVNEMFRYVFNIIIKLDNF